MRLTRGAAAAIGVVVLAAGVAQAAPAEAATTATTGGSGWHRVHEGWTPVTQPDVTFPAARYCGSFDLKSTVVSQDIRAKVTSRWDNGVPRQTLYVGPLTMKVTNTSTGESKNYFMGGDAIETDDATGAMETYQMMGPVGFGMPIGSSHGIAPGAYVFQGFHVVQFADDGSRTLTRSSGPAIDLCTELG